MSRNVIGMILFALFAVPCLAEDVWEEDEVCTRFCRVHRAFALCC